MVYSQRIAVFCTETQMVLHSTSGDIFFSYRHDQLFGEFLAKTYRRSGRRTTSHLPTFSQAYDRGHIQNLAVWSAYFSFVLQKAFPGIGPLTSIELVCVVSPHHSTVEKELWSETARLVGCHDVLFCSIPLSGLVGSGFSFPLSTFGLFLYLDQSESFCSGCSFDRTLFTHDLPLSGDSVQEAVRVRFFAHNAALLQSPKAHVFLRLLPSLCFPLEPHELPELLALIPEELRTYIHPGELRALCSEFFTRTCLRLRALLTARSEQELGAITSQGILLFGTIGEQAGVSLALSSAIGIPVFHIAHGPKVLVDGAARIHESLS